ncbi:hypothetical protein JTE90_001824, partial [Oedothorax gibbosus]
HYQTFLKIPKTLVYTLSPAIFLNWFDVLEPNVVVLERTHKMHKFKKVLLAANFGSMSEEKEFPKAYGNIKAALTTPGPTRTRVRSKGFTISPGAAFIAEVTLQHNSSPVARRD